MSEQADFIMKNFNLRNTLFKDRSGNEASGKRTEVIIALMIGFMLTALWAFMYPNPVAAAISGITSISALVALIQIFREKIHYPRIFPILVMISVVAISTLAGKGSQDLIWMSSLGAYLLVNIYSARNDDLFLFLFGFLTVAAFISVGVLEMSGILPNPYGTDARHIFVGSAILLGIMGVLTAVFHKHRALLRSAEEAKIEEGQARKQLENMNYILEEQVNARTNELGKLNEQLLTKTAKLQAASDISQAILSKPDQSANELLTRTARLISEKLGYYHVGIFLVDAVRGYAVLRATNSAGGQQMLAKQHQLKIGGTGIVGYVSQSGRPRIALDTGADAVFFNNPYLPETRSEISLPIKYGNSVLGVLDVQSTQSAAFNDEDANTLMTIANQLAVLLQRKDEGAIATDAKTSKRFAQTDVWEKPIGYSFQSDGSIISNAILTPSPFVEKAIASGETVTVNRPPKGSLPLLAVPVKFRDQVIGIIQIEADEVNRNWTEDEVLLVQAVTERAAVALENARLFESATRRAEQEETISRVTTQIGASTDFDRILQTTIQELGLALGASRSFIQIGASAISDEEATE